tara:strand:+ start:1005 stop:1358 length:354 start_codon:yes stop_codon:yes gene_type:complete
MIPENKLEELLQDITSDYINWKLASCVARDYPTDHVQDSIKRFKNSLSIKKGRKYIKIISDGSVWGFINVSNPDFKEGDILMASSWNSPALNKARGNLFESYDVKWTSPKYLNQLGR